MHKFLYPSKENILDLLDSDIHYRNYNTFDYINNLNNLNKNLCSLQKLPDYMSNIWSDIGINLDQTYDLKSSMLQIKDAFEYITKYDNDYMSFYTKSLIKSIHLLKTDNDYNDISFSDPNLPYTIFINLPDINLNNWLERTVENLIHETMHLLLSLLEKKYDFYLSTNKKIYSPWKHEPRNNKGILHAVYVFSHLKKFWEKVYSSEKTSFSKKRIEEIQKQLSLLKIEELTDFYSKDGLKLLNICFM